MTESDWGKAYLLFWATQRIRNGGPNSYFLLNLGQVKNMFLEKTIAYPYMRSF